MPHSTCLSVSPSCSGLGTGELDNYRGCGGLEEEQGLGLMEVDDEVEVDRVVAVSVVDVRHGTRWW